MYALQAAIHIRLIQLATFAKSPAAQHIGLMICVGVALSIVAQDVMAMPWEGPICSVARSLSGPMAKAIAVIAVVISGLLLAFGELGGIFKTFMGLLMGIAMALMAVQWVGFIDGTGAGGFC